jgi:hypothetical protein
MAPRSLPTSTAARFPLGIDGAASNVILVSTTPDRMCASWRCWEHTPGEAPRQKLKSPGRLVAEESRRPRQAGRHCRDGRVVRVVQRHRRLVARPNEQPLGVAVPAAIICSNKLPIR